VNIIRKKIIAKGTRASQIIRWTKLDDTVDIMHIQCRGLWCQYWEWM